jgi:hypothetical protein
MCSTSRRTVLLQRNALAKVPRLSRFPLPAEGYRSPAGRDPPCALQAALGIQQIGAIAPTPCSLRRSLLPHRRIGPSEVVFASHSALLRFLVVPGRSRLCHASALSPLSAGIRADQVSRCRWSDRALRARPTHGYLPIALV